MRKKYIIEYGAAVNKNRKKSEAFSNNINEMTIIISMQLLHQLL
jgi:hypothetical protein